MRAITGLLFIVTSLLWVNIVFANLSDGLVAHYKFDGNTNDSSSNHLDGVLQSATLGNGKFGYGLDLTGNENARVIVNDNDLLDITDNLTVSVWVKRTGHYRSHHPMIVVKNNVNTSYLLWSSADHRSLENSEFAFRVDLQGYDPEVYSGVAPQIGVWYHVVGVRDGDSLKIYVDGLLKAEEHISNAKISTTDGNLTIGDDNINEGRGAFNGNIDEVRIYNRALTTSEIAELAGSHQPTAYQGIIKQTPRNGSPGTVFTQVGTDFTPNNTVTLHFLNHLGESLPTLQLSTDTNGAFTTDYATSYDISSGTHIWWAVDDKTNKRSEPLGYFITGESGEKTEVAIGVGSGKLPPIRVNVPFGELTSEADFDPTKETFVIVHGWNTTDNNSLPDWVKKLGKAIKYDAPLPSKGSNVLYWNWQEMARGKVANSIWDSSSHESCMDVYFSIGAVKYEIPFDETAESGRHLAQVLGEVIPQTYDHNIHFLGHSLGSLVISYAAKLAHRYGFAYSNNIKHIVFFDSPCYAGVLGENFLEESKNTIFFENYVSEFGRYYNSADVNIYHDKADGIVPLAGHSYSYDWYRSSVTNFSDQTILNDNSVPTKTLPWGFYWCDENHRSSIHATYSQGHYTPHYSLFRGTTLERNIGKIVDAGNALADATVDTVEWVGAYTIRAGKKVYILTTNTFDDLTDITGYIIDTAGHAIYDSLIENLGLMHASTAVLTIPLNLPSNANALTFSYEFLYGESGSCKCY